MSPTHWIRDVTMHRPAALAVLPLLVLLLCSAVATAAEPCRVVVWDERRTPATDVEKGADGSVTVRVQMPLCVFPAWKAHGLPSTVRVISIRPGHETFPIYDDAHMLRLVENVARTSRAAATP